MKAAKHESDAKGSKPSLWKAVSVILDVGIHRPSNAGDKARHQSHANRKRPGVVHVMDEGATDERRGDVADRTDHRSL